MSKVKCYSVRLASLEAISEKAYKATAFDGTTAIIPKSQVFGSDTDVEKSDAWWISAWILEQKELQYSQKKVSYFDKDRADFIPDTGVEVERHIPQEKAAIETAPIPELVKEENLMQEMKAAVKSRKAQVLTTYIAADLKGKRIQTIYFGYRGQDGVDDLVVGDVISAYELASRQVDQDTWPQGSQAKYWESIWSADKIERSKQEMHLLAADGRNTYITTEPGDCAFHCSDADRLVYYIVAE